MWLRMTLKAAVANASQLRPPRGKLNVWMDGLHAVYAMLRAIK
jgi:hypothetical protein